MTIETSVTHELEILHCIAENPDTTQADLATQLGVAVGSVNWYIKRLIKKGYIKVTQMQKRKLRYLLTPEGITEKARLTASFVQASFKWYRKTREATQQWIEHIRQAGYDTVCIDGDGDLSEVVYLTCIEAHIRVKEYRDHAYPVFTFDGLNVLVEWPKDGPHCRPNHQKEPK